ncbi:nucleotide-binding universal stress UspA family protein [Gillisia mitskevichiae]|uniref:Nucleotide-binding universal stress UspA family protein n=1 Tax=Gillisia mitskevichiae TaxID=270921 RepID=A0A495PIN3_9FLAO|nr:universal stress protein [Gillisia mitskevichiae]RKS50543.1 nucleotide-binding universal stress UspA family protein [Gillisia mitskevichiae]
MRKILIPTDFSNNAFNALKFALNLFKDDPCEFYLINAFQLYYFTTDSLLAPEPGEPAYDKAKIASKTGLEDLIEQISVMSESSIHKFQTLSAYNSILEAIEEAIEAHKIELIIMGTKGSNNQAAKLYGSSAVTVIQNIKKCPVLIIPEHTPYLHGVQKEIVLATNYKISYKLAEISYLKDIAKKYHAAIRVLYVKKHNEISDDQLYNKNLLKEYFKDITHSFHILNQANVLQGIRSFIESRESTILAVVNKKHNFLHNIFSKSILKEIGYEPKIPILILHDSRL